MGAKVKHKGDRQFRRLVHDVATSNNLKGIAAIYDIPYSTLAAQLNPNGEEKLDVALLPLIIEAAEDDRVVHYLCSLRSMVAYRIPEGQCTTVKLARCVKEFGELMTAGADMDKNGIRTAAEMERVRQEGYEAIQAIAAYLASLDQDD